MKLSSDLCGMTLPLARITPVTTPCCFDGAVLRAFMVPKTTLTIDNLVFQSKGRTVPIPMDLCLQFGTRHHEGVHDCTLPGWIQSARSASVPAIN